VAVFFFNSCSCWTSDIPSYNETSQVWALSFLSGIGNAHRANSSDALLDETITAMKALLGNGDTQKLIGKWDIVWGPVIYSRRSAIAGNCVVIVKNQDSPTWVISIAGTNPRSLLDWLEDIRVRLTIPWHRVVSSAPRSSGSIARGTHEGLMDIIEMVDTNNGETILEFLKKTDFTLNSSLYISGHSLGGALTSVVGLYLIDNESSWKTEKDNVTIKFRPTAGPTPGNSDWNDYFFSRINSYPNTF